MTQSTLTEINSEEKEYLKLIETILERGENRVDRTGTGILGVFGPPQIKYSLENGQFPLLTTKKVFYRGIFEELFWFIRGETNAKLLQDKKVNIWDGNASRSYLDSIGLTERQEGDLGPVYGFQWRHFGAVYKDCHTDYKGQGVDQLADVIQKIQTDPTNRRIILSAWNPADLKLMALPPCHMFCQFYVHLKSTSTTEASLNKPRLSCILYQRSCDVGLGVPFNIASYALLTILIAHVTCCEPYEFIHTMGDTHIYLNHLDALKIQTERTPRAFPKLFIDTAPGGGLEALENITFGNIKLEGYNPHEKLNMSMAV